MAKTFTDCAAGTWYGFDSTDLNIGQTVQVQFGAFDEGTTNLNIYLTRPGGSLVQSLVLNAGFGRSSSIYRLYNSSSTCELDQLNLTIPSDAGVATNAVQTFQFGVFNSSVPLGQDGNALSGFLSWSPDIQVWNNVTTTTSAAPTTSATSITSTTAPSTTTTSAADNNSSGGLSSGAKIGMGIGIGLGGVLIGALIAWICLLKRRKHRAAAVGQPDAPMESFTKSPGPGPGSDAAGKDFAANIQNQGLHELPPAATQQTNVKGYYQSVPQQSTVHEMPSSHQAYEMA